MKDINRFLQSLILTACCFAFVACSDENTPTTNTLEIEASNTFFNVEGGTKEVLLANTAAKAYAQDSWLHVQTDGKKVKYTSYYKERSRRLCSFEYFARRNILWSSTRPRNS